MKRLCKNLGQLWVFLNISMAAYAQDAGVIQIYPTDDLAVWIEKNQHLTRVLEDDCQLVQDIQARAKLMKLPTYQFLWGDMLTWGICVDKNVELGLYYIERSAEQGLPTAFEQLGRYYAQGIIYQKDIERGYQLLLKAARLDVIRAQIQLVELMTEGHGSPLDYEAAYRWLYFAEIGDTTQHARAQELLEKLALLMPKAIVERAKTQPYKQGGLHW